MRPRKTLLMPKARKSLEILGQNLKLAGIRPEANVLLVRGSIPGANGTLVVVRKALKKAGRA